MASSPEIKLVSKCFINPNFKTESDRPHFLAPSDLALLSAHYIQEGLLFAISPSTSEENERFDFANFIESLKNSLPHTLRHFYPLAGQFATQIEEDDEESRCFIFVDCGKGPGVGFIHATLQMKISDIVSAIDVPQIVQMFFDHHKAVNYDGHTRPLLSIQVTELIDGVFIGCSMNHAVCDGTSYWNFWRTWSQIHTSPHLPTSNPPILSRWLPQGLDPRVTLPFSHPDEFISRYEAPLLRQRIFHASSDSISKLKMKANAEVAEAHSKISSLQALSALAWRAITRARGLGPDQETSCNLVANLRHRLDPPLPEEYFGSLIWVAKATCTSGDLLGHDLGWGARLLNLAVAELTDEKIRGVLEAWIQSPFCYHINSFFDANSVVIGNSPRFDVYGNEFGLGKPVAVRSGYGDKFPGKISAYPGAEGGGSMDLEICLSPKSMEALELDAEFVVVVTSR